MDEHGGEHDADDDAEARGGVVVMDVTNALFEAMGENRPVEFLQEILRDSDDPNGVRQRGDGGGRRPLHHAVLCGASEEVIRFVANAHLPALQEADGRRMLAATRGRPVPGADRRGRARRKARWARKHRPSITVSTGS
jgi:hypothetical protein